MDQITEEMKCKAENNYAAEELRDWRDILDEWLSEAKMLKEKEQNIQYKPIISET